MNWLVKLAKPLIKRMVRRELEDKDNKEKVIILINSKIDIPKMNEQEEAELFSKIYDAFKDSLDLIVDRL